MVGVEDNFFALGGDSILSLQVASRALAAGLRVKARDVFRYQTVAQLAAAVLAVLLLALDNEEEVVLRLPGALENGNVYWVGLRLV